MATSKKKRSIFSRIISTMITLTCLAVFVYASYGLVDAVIDYYNNRKLLNSLQDLYYEADGSEDDSAPFSIRSGFEGLLEQNDDVVGWITVDGTQIDYPILQGETNETYLRHNFYGEESRAGSIFLDYRNDIDSLGYNTIVYGHRMKDGSMFQHLTKFSNKDFFDEHRTFTFDTLYESYEGEIFAVYKTMTNFNYIQTEFDNDSEFDMFLMEIMKRSEHTADVDLTDADKIITLSTCDYQLDKLDGRLVVHAKLKKVG